MSATPAFQSVSVAVPTYGVGEDMAIVLDGLVLVSSKSHPTCWRRVEQGECSCEGFIFTGRCRHIGVAKVAEEMDRLSAVPESERCACGQSPYTLVMDGQRFCALCAPRLEVVR